MRLVVGMSGASGAMYGIRVLEIVNRAGVGTDLEDPSGLWKQRLG